MQSTISQAVMELDKNYILPDAKFSLTIRDISRMYKNVLRKESENLSLRAKIASLELQLVVERDKKDTPKLLVYG